MKTYPEHTTAQTPELNADALDIACGANTLALQNRRGIGEWIDGRGRTIGFYVYDNTRTSASRTSATGATRS